MKYTVDDVKELRILIPLGTGAEPWRVPGPDGDRLTQKAKDMIAPRILEAYIQALNRDGAVPVQFPGFVGMKHDVEMEGFIYRDVAVYQGTAVITGDEFPSYQEVTAAGWRKAMEVEDEEA